MHAFNEDMQRSILENFSKDLPNTNYTLNGAARYCEKCRHIKPDRAHHCSVCGECILKMDHHCPWINNCVCFTNYKFFILFLGYSLVYCIYIALTSLQYFILFWKASGKSKLHCQSLTVRLIIILGRFGRNWQISHSILVLRRSDVCY